MTAGTQYIYDGTQWQAANAPAAPAANQIDNYTTPGTFTITPPPSFRFLWLELIGAGGAGQYVFSGGQSSGGGGGEYIAMLMAADTILSYALVVGAGGSNNNSGSAGPNGGNTTFNGLTAHGGYGAGKLVANTGGFPGGASYVSGTMPSTGDLTLITYTAGGMGGAHNMPNTTFGGGGGGGATVAQGGTLADQFGALKAGNGGGNSGAGISPGGGSGVPTSATPIKGGDGAARFTWIF